MTADGKPDWLDEAEPAARALLEALGFTVDQAVGAVIAPGVSDERAAALAERLHSSD